MTILNTSSKIEHTQALSEFTIPFHFNRERDIDAIVYDSAGIEHGMTAVTDFLVERSTFKLVSNTQVWIENGKLKPGFKLVIYRQTPIIQETDIRNQGEYFPESIEDQLDYLTMIAQEIVRNFNSNVKIALADLTDVEIHNIYNGQTIAFNAATGTFIASDMTSSVKLDSLVDVDANGVDGDVLYYDLSSLKYKFKDIVGGFIKKDGSTLMPPSYNPTSDNQIVTKKYVDNLMTPALFTAGDDLAAGTGVAIMPSGEIRKILQFKIVKEKLIPVALSSGSMPVLLSLRNGYFVRMDKKTATQYRISIVNSASLTVAVWQYSFQRSGLIHPSMVFMSKTGTVTKFATAYIRESNKAPSVTVFEFDTANPGNLKSVFNRAVNTETVGSYSNVSLAYNPVDDSLCSVFRAGSDPNKIRVLKYTGVANESTSMLTHYHASPEAGVQQGPVTELVATDVLGVYVVQSNRGAYVVDTNSSTAYGFKSITGLNTNQLLVGIYKRNNSFYLFYPKGVGSLHNICVSFNPSSKTIVIKSDTEISNLIYGQLAIHGYIVSSYADDTSKFMIASSRSASYSIDFSTFSIDQNDVMTRTGKTNSASNKCHISGKGDRVGSFYDSSTGNFTIEAYSSGGGISGEAGYEPKKQIQITVQPSDTLPNFIGFAKKAALIGTQAEVLTQSDILESQNLSLLNDYYLTNTGSVALSGTKKIGRAISPTKIKLAWL